MKQRHRLHVTIYQQNVNSLRNIVEKMYTLLNVVKKLVENAVCHNFLNNFTPLMGFKDLHGAFQLLYLFS